MDMNEPKQPDGWERLTCLCGQSRFSPTVNLRWRAGSGVTQEIGGYFCLECHAIVDSAQLISQAQVRAKKRELKELESEILESTEPIAASTVRKEKHAGAAK
jgi:hypothetical protein